MLVALDLASCSTKVDELLDVLNNAGVKHGPKSYLHLAWLESRLRQMSNDQGLGFQVMGVVVDKKTIKRAFIAMGAGLFTIATTLVALNDDAVIAGSGASSACLLSVTQVATFKAAMTGSNCSAAAYDNVRLGSVLWLKTDDVESLVGVVAGAPKGAFASADSSDLVLCYTPILLRIARVALKHQIVVQFGLSCGLLCVFMTFYNIAVLTKSAAHLEHEGVLGIIRDLAFGLSVPIFSLLLPGLRKVALDGGNLDALGFRTLKVRRSDVRSLRTISAVMTLLMSIWVPMISFAVTRVFILGIPKPQAPEWAAYEKNGTTLSLESRARNLPMVLSFGIFVPFAIMFYIALKIGAMLASVAVRNQTEIIKATSPKTDDWEAKAVSGCMRLIKVVLPSMSDGFSSGLLSFFAAFWLFSFGMGLDMLLGSRSQSILDWFLAGCFAFLPLGMSLGAATTSTQCDSLQESLNDKRCESINDSDEKLERLERSLERCNRGQGLGFVVGGRVMDRRTLQLIGASMCGALTTVVPLIFGLNPPTSFVNINMEMCALSDTQTASVQAALLDANASCSYDNVTLASVLRLKADDNELVATAAAPAAAWATEAAAGAVMTLWPEHKLVRRMLGGSILTVYDSSWWAWGPAAQWNADAAGQAEPGFLIYAVTLAGGCSDSFSVFTMDCALRVLMPGGALEKLGLGNVLVSDAERKSLQRWRWGVNVVANLFPLTNLSRQRLLVST